MLNILHKTLVGNSIPQPFRIHNDEVIFFSDGGIMSVQAFYVGEVEYHQMKYILDNCLKRGMTFLDIGGHHGAFTTIIAFELRKRKLDGKIYIFEPDTRNLEFINKNLKCNNLNSFVEIIPKAVSNLSGRGKFVFSSDNSCNWLEIDSSELKGEIIHDIVEVVTIDDWAKDKLKIDCIKLDIQGGELNALKGAKNTIEKHKPILFVEIMDYSKDAPETKLYLINLGYDLFQITKDSRLVSNGDSEAFISWDIIAIYNNNKQL